MIDRSPSPDELNSLFAQLNPLDVEQFYTAYQLWNIQQRIQTQQALIDAIQRDIAENATYLEQAHPSALALATLARLQASGVSDITILDRMLERGEEWLDRTMQRLDSCENMDMISGDYTRWCENALEGAYDWIDSMTGQETVEVTPGEMPSSTEDVNGATGSITHEEIGKDSVDNTPSDESIEELFLQKLMSDDAETDDNRTKAENTENTVIVENKEAIIEDEASMFETTLKIGAVSPLPEESLPPEGNNIDAIDTSTTSIENADNANEATDAVHTIDEAFIAPSTPSLLPPEQETRPDAVEPTPVLAETHAMLAEENMTAVEEPVAQEQQPLSLHEKIEPEEIAQQATAIAPSPPAEVKPERGFWRTLIAVLFHI